MPMPAGSKTLVPIGTLLWLMACSAPPTIPGEEHVARADAHLAAGRDAESTAAYRLAAEAGHPGGQLMLGAAYVDGRGVHRDLAEAERWFTKAAEQGNARAQHHLGEMVRDREQRRVWMFRSAQSGYAPAQRLAALMLLADEDPSKDREAHEYLAKAAEAGDAEAQGFLGYTYLDGRGTLQSHQKAYQWLTLAASRAKRRAEFVSARDKARRLISASQAEEAYRAAEAWLAAHERQQAQPVSANRWWPIPWASTPTR